MDEVKLNGEIKENHFRAPSLDVGDCSEPCVNGVQGERGSLNSLALAPRR